MKQINKILLPTDFSTTSDHALRYAIWLSTVVEAEIQLLHIVDFTMAPMEAPEAAAAFMAEGRKLAETLLQKQVDRTVTQVNITHNLEVLPAITPNVQTGGIVWQITSMAEENNIDLIVMGTRGEHQLLDRVVGSVASETIRKAPCPVLVVPPEFQKQQINTVAYATDLSKADPYRIWETLRLLHPIKPYFKIAHVLNKANSKEEMKKMENLRLYFADNPAGVEMSYSTLAPHAIQPDADITAFVKTSDADLLIMYRSEHSFFNRLFLQSVTKNIALSTKTPILVLK